MSIIYNGVTLTDLFTVEYHVERTLAAWSPQLVDVPGGDGALLSGSRALPTTVSMTLYAIGDTREQRQASMRTLAAALAVREPKQLILDDEDGLYRMAVPTDESTISAYLNADSVGLSFVCPDPRLYGETKTKTVGTSATSVTIGGTAATALTVTVTATPNSSGNWTLTNVTTGEYMLVKLATGSSHAVVIDCAKRTLTVDGAVKALSTDSDWLVLDPATYSMRVTAGTGTATLSWQEMWW